MKIATWNVNSIRARIDNIKKYLKLTDLPPFKLVLKKNIPLGSGLGGGSADSAALIRLLNNFLK